MLEEAYEGWGPKLSPRDKGPERTKETNLRGLFPQAGVVHHILPTGGMRIPRPNAELFTSGNGGGANVDGTKALWETRRIRFVVQVGVVGRTWGPGHVEATGQNIFCFDAFEKSPDTVTTWSGGMGGMQCHCIARGLNVSPLDVHGAPRRFRRL